MHQILFISFILVLAPSFCYGEARSFGHLSTRNDYMMDDFRCSFGLQFTGCRIDQTLLGISPFLYIGYDLNSIFIRQRLKEAEYLNQTVDLAFVETNASKVIKAIPSEKKVYEMRAVMFTLEFPKI